MGTAAGRRVLIIGAGVGGLTTAIALRRIGVHAVVFERASDVKKIQAGGALHVWTNATKPLRQLGLLDSVLDVSSELMRMDFRSASGEVLVSWSVNEKSRRLGAPSIAMSRVDLHKVLLDAVGDDIVHLNSEFVSFTQDDEGVTARFADGREEHGDLLIAADGSRSKIRDQLLGPTPVKYAGYSAYGTIGIFNGAMPPADLFAMWYGRGKRIISFRVGGGRQHWLAIVNSTQGLDDRGTRKASLLKWYRDWESPIPEMIEASDEAEITRVDIFGIEPLQSWGTGRVTLLGDAAHPTTPNLGQGACQAIEDGYVLAKHLQAQPDIPTALRSFAAARMERTADIMKRAWWLGTMGQLDNPLYCWIRNFTMRFLVGWKIERDTTEISAYEA